MGNMINLVKIPHDRIAVVIGKDGKTKKKIEKETSTHLDIDSNEGEVNIKSEEALNIFNCSEIIKAIGRGFSPDVALKLTRIDNVLEIISISDYVKTKNDMIRLRGRVIGKTGKTRRTFEDILEVNMSIYGKTIAVIGKGEYVAAARRAIDSLLNGSQHSNVYSWMEKQRVKLKKLELENKIE